MNIRTLIVGLILAAILPASAREGKGRWTKESEAEYTYKIISNIKKEQEERHERLTSFNKDIVAKITFPHFGSSGSKEAQELNAKFLEGKLNPSKSKAYVLSLIKDLHLNQKILAAAESAAAPQWEQHQKGVKNSEKEHTAEVLGNPITGLRIGVILDSSPSMKPYADKLREEIRKEFPYAYFVEVDGCALTPLYTTLGSTDSSIFAGKSRLQHCAWFFVDPPKHLNPFKPHWHSPEDLRNFARVETHYEWFRLSRSTYSAILGVVNYLEVDTLYWMSDFQDDVERSVSSTIIGELEKRKVRLYLHTLDKRPKSDWTKYAKASGGKYIRKKMD